MTSGCLGLGLFGWVYSFVRLFVVFEGEGCCFVCFYLLFVVVCGVTD